MSDRKKIILAIVGSLVLHLIIILGSSRVIALWPAASLSPQKEDQSPPQLTMLDTPPPEEQKEDKQERQYLRTNDDQKTDQKPVDSMFESDKDTAAASEQPAKGDAPIPTQEGKEAPDIGFKNESFSLADRGQAFSTDPGQQDTAPQKEEKQEEVKPVETPTPAATPKPEAKPSPAPTPPPAARTEVAQADKEPTATPAPTPEVVPSDQQFAMLRPPPAQSPAPTPAATPTVEQPTPTPVPTPEEVFPTDEQLAMLRPTPTPRPTRVRQAERMPQRQSAPQTAYRQEQRITRMQGNINNRGRSSIAALGTPQGRFEKAVQDAIGSRWYFYVRERSDLINIGTVQIKFYVRPDGKVEDVKVLRNSSNETLASTSLQSIIEANIPPMPDELAPLLSG